jgi:hypothetical protein
LTSSGSRRSVQGEHGRRGKRSNLNSHRSECVLANEVIVKEEKREFFFLWDSGLKDLRRGRIRPGHGVDIYIRKA